MYEGEFGPAPCKTTAPACRASCCAGAAVAVSKAAMSSAANKVKSFMMEMLEFGSRLIAEFLGRLVGFLRGDVWL